MSSMDAAIHAMKQFGFDDEAVVAKMRELLKEHGGQYGFIEIYSVLLEALLSNQDKEKWEEESQGAAHRETSNTNGVVDREMVEEGNLVVPTSGFIDIPVCSSIPRAAISPPPSSQSLPASSPVVDAALPPPPPVMEAALQLPPPPQYLPASSPVVDVALPSPPPVMDAALQLPPPPRYLPASSPVVDAALPPPPPVMDAALQLPPPPQYLPALSPVVDTALPPPRWRWWSPPPVMDAALQLPPPPLLDGKILPPETPPSQQGQPELSGWRKDCPRPRSRCSARSRSVNGNQSHHPVPVPSSRYESQKRRDWNTFGDYLKIQTPPVSVSECNVSHVLEFLRYLDQFGKTKVHLHGCVYYGQLFPLDTPCTCPLRQAWGSLDSITGRLRAAYEDNVGACEKNPFGNKAIYVYLRQVKECQAKARGVSYEKKRKNKIKANDEAK